MGEGSLVPIFIERYEGISKYIIQEEEDRKRKLLAISSYLFSSS